MKSGVILNWGSHVLEVRSPSNGAAGAAILYDVQAAAPNRRWEQYSLFDWTAPALDVRRVLEEAPVSKKEVSIRRQAVLDLIKQHTQPMTSKEMARQLKVKEVSVRAAIIWLEIGGFIKKDGHVMKLYKSKNCRWLIKKKVAMYSWTGRNDAICKLRIKEADEPEREQMKKCYGDGGLALQEVMRLMVGGKGR
jgi:hypothetical protein